MLKPSKDFLTHAWPWDLRFRGAGKPGEYDGLWKINEYTDHLYTNPRKENYDSLDNFHWDGNLGTGYSIPQFLDLIACRLSRWNWGIE